MGYYGGGRSTLSIPGEGDPQAQLASSRPAIERTSTHSGSVDIWGEMGEAKTDPVWHTRIASLGAIVKDLGKHRSRLSEPSRAFQGTPENCKTQSTGPRRKYTLTNHNIEGKGSIFDVKLEHFSPPDRICCPPSRLRASTLHAKFELYIRIGMPQGREIQPNRSH